MLNVFLVSTANARVLRLVSTFSVTNCVGIWLTLLVRNAATLLRRFEPNVCSRLVTLLLWYLFSII